MLNVKIIYKIKAKDRYLSIYKKYTKVLPLYTGESLTRKVLIKPRNHLDK
jgi:hypothetical protein